MKVRVYSSLFVVGLFKKETDVPWLPSLTKKKLECIYLDLERVFFFFCLAVGGEARGTSSLRWPTPSDLNTRLRRIIAGYQRVVKKQELKKAAAEKVRVIISNPFFSCEQW